MPFPGLKDARLAVSRATARKTPGRGGLGPVQASWQARDCVTRNGGTLLKTDGAGGNAGNDAALGRLSEASTIQEAPVQLLVFPGAQHRLGSREAWREITRAGFTAEISVFR
jgi:hypothetical protein